MSRDTTVEIMGVPVNVLSAKKAMERVQEYVKHDDGLSSIYFASLGTLLKADESEDFKEALLSYNLRLAEETTLFDELRIDDNARRQEIERRLFTDTLMKYLIRTQMKVYMLWDSEEQKEKQLPKWLKRYEGFVPVGHGVITETDKLINALNADAADVVISAASTPFDEFFLKENSAKIHAGLWITLAGRTVRQEKKGLLAAWRSFREKLRVKGNVHKEIN